MISTLGKNRKKDRLCIEHILSNLRDMQNMLSREKAEELDTHIVRLAKVQDIIMKEDLTKFNHSYILMTLERESRYIKRGFVYGKIKDNMRTSYEDDTKAPAETVNAEEAVGGQNAAAE
jgi:hypothetical protein